MSLQVLRMLEKRKDVVEHDIFYEIKTTFPPGSIVGFEKGNGRVLAEVLRHGYRGQLYIRNTKTNKEYWIDYHDLIK